MSQASVPVRNAKLSALATAIGASPTLEFRTGVTPANCASSDTGTAVASGTLPSTPFGTPSGGVMAQAGTWQVTGSATNYVGHYRMKQSGTCHLQGLVAQTWQASTAYALTQQVSNGGNTYRCTTAGTSASSGGPTGTGGSISDGTVTWAYAGPSDMILDNTNIAVSQVVNITTYTQTEGNA